MFVKYCGFAERIIPMSYRVIQITRNKNIFEKEISITTAHGANSKRPTRQAINTRHKSELSIFKCRNRWRLETNKALFKYLFRLLLV